VDVRKEDDFKEGHLPHSVNIQEDGKFETWLGSIIKPEEQFYVAAKDEEQVQRILLRVAAIGYETAIAETIIVKGGHVQEAEIDVELFKKHSSDYTIVDVRNVSEVNEGKIFANSISIPLAEVRDRVNEIPIDKPIVVYCAGGYRSAAGSSIIKSALDGKVKVFDLSEAIKQFQ
jgi:rhodanese-related sulfurtransferase